MNSRVWLTNHTVPFCLALAILVTLGCARSSDVPKLSVGAVIADVPMTFKVPMFLGILKANLHVPLVEVRVNGGDPTKFIVDTGSTHNVLTKRFAEAHAIGSRPAKQGRDHSGEAVEVRAADPVRLAIGPLERTIADTLVIDAPPELDRFDIGGFISPQALLERGCVVLDFPGERFIVSDQSLADVARSISSAHADRAVTTHPQVAVPGAPDGKIFVHVTLDDGPPITAALDTGSKQTEVLASLAGVSDLRRDAAGTGVSGKRTVGTLVEGRRIHFATRTFGPMSVLARESIQKWTASIGASVGMDILRELVVVIPAGRDSNILVGGGHRN